MTSFRKIFSDTAIPVAGKILSLFISIALIKLLSINLGVVGFGYYATIFEFLALFMAIADFGIYVTSVKELAGCDKKDVPHILGNTIGLHLVMAAISMVAAVFIVALIPDYRETPIVLGVWFATTMVLIDSATRGMKAILQVHYKIRYGTFAAITGKVARLGWIIFILVLLARDNSGYSGLGALFVTGQINDSQLASTIYLVIAGFTFGSITEFLITYYYARRYQILSIRFDFKYWAAFFRKTYPYAIAIFLGQAYFRADILILSWLEGPESVGIYAVAMRLIENSAFIPVVFVNALLPSLITEVRQQNKQNVEALLIKGWLFLLSVALPIVFLTTTFSVPLTLLLSSYDFLSGTLQKYGSDVAIQISVWALLFSFLNKLMVFTTLSIGKHSKILMINFAGLVFNIAMNLVFIPRYGLVAAAITTVLSEMIVFGMSFAVVRLELDFRPPLLRTGGVVLSAVVVFGAARILFGYGFDAESISAMLMIGTMSCVIYFWVLKTTALRTYLYAISLAGKRQ